MTICRFYLQGRCRYGDRCWNEHVDPSPAPQRRDNYPVPQKRDNYPVPQRRDNYTWVSPSVASSRNYPQTQPSRGNFSSQYREPDPRYNYSNDYSWSSSTPRNQYSDRYGSGNVSSGYYDHRSSESYERSKSPKQNTYFQAKPSNRFEVLSQVNDTGSNDRESNIIPTVKSDITEWEESHIWPFSCHSHFKDHRACLSGFVDLSPEELRCRAYEAEKSGSFALYTGIVVDAMNEVKKKWDVLKNPTADVLRSIESYQGTPDFCAENLKKLIGDITTGSFGGQVNSEMFVQDNSAKASSGSFSFKLAHTDPSQPLGSSTSAFKSVLPTANKVENSLPPFGASSSTSSVFGSTSASLGFGSTASLGFGFSSASSGFGSSSASSGFGSSSTSVVASSSTPSIFSGFGSSKEKVDGSTKTSINSEIKSRAYTPLEDLTESERTQFSSQTFTLGKIPSRPPPFELCF